MDQQDKDKILSVMSDIPEEVEPIDMVYNYMFEESDRDEVINFYLHDGDSVTRSVLDEGFLHSWKKVAIRLYGIDTPEVNKTDQKAAGKAVRDLLRAMSEDAGLVWLKSFKLSNHKYGSPMGCIYFDRLNVNLFLLNQGLAKFYKGGKKEPWTEQELLKIEGKAKHMLSEIRAGA